MLTRRTILRRLQRAGALIDAHTHVGIDPALYLRGDFPYALSGEDLVLRLDAQGLDAAVCFPMLYTDYFRLAPFRQGRFRRDPHAASAFPYQAENSCLCLEIYDAFPACQGRLLPFAFFDPARRPREQAAFLYDLAARYPLFGLKTATSYLQSPITALLRDGACLLDTAAALDVPVTIHTSVHPDDPWADVFEILKVVRARPDVRFNLAHTCRFDRRALDQAAALPNCFVDCSAFHIHCLLARRNSPVVAAAPHRFRADYRRHAAALEKLATAYPDTLLWGSDAPYSLFKSRFFDAKGREQRVDLPCDPQTEAREFNKLPAEVRARIGQANTLRWLGCPPARVAVKESDAKCADACEGPSCGVGRKGGRR
jgi:predicted TIM-barrel fold metal-dependent hydrolase